MQEQIRKHQIQLQSLHREIAEFTHQYADLQVISIASTLVVRVF